jgi:hypothetical protein
MITVDHREDAPAIHVKAPSDDHHACEPPGSYCWTRPTKTSSMGCRVSRLFPAAALLVSITVAPAVAHAQELTPAQRSANLGRVLDAYATDARDVRLGTALGEGVVGIAALVPGIVLLGRNDPQLQLIGTGLVVVGAFDLLGVPGLFIPTNIEHIHDHWEERSARGEDPATLTRSIEAELYSAAERRRSNRIVYGVTSLVLGVAAFATGMVFILQPAGIFGMDSQTQLVAGSILVGAGAGIAGSGALDLFRRSAEESAWAAYAGPRPRPEPPVTARLAVVPTSHGAVGALQLSF